MIAIETQDGELVKVLGDLKNETIGFHSLFGFLSEKKAGERLTARKLKGFEFDDKASWLCQFGLNLKNKTLDIKNANGCEVKKITDSSWSLATSFGDFIIQDKTQATFTDMSIVCDDKATLSNKFFEYGLLLLCILAPIIYLLNHSPVEEEIKEEKKSEPIVVKIIKQQEAVNIQRKSAAMKIKPLTKSDIAKRAVKRNLGFLGLVGSKTNTKVVGGVPQKLKAATAGAGAGGDAGSGGEVLTGLGKGLKKTTVGNTGVAGLGGVGTKGAGGGKGGYGNTMVASGSGRGISAVAVSSNDMVLDGGLSRYVINATIAKYLGQVRRCYESQLKMNPGLEGLVAVNFEINGAGMLNHSRVANSTLRNSTVEKCITTKMMSWKFPKPKGGVKVNINYPFMLRPVGS